MAWVGWQGYQIEGKIFYQFTLASRAMPIECVQFMGKEAQERGDIYIYSIILNYGWFKFLYGKALKHCKAITFQFKKQQKRKTQTIKLFLYVKKVIQTYDVLSYSHFTDAHHSNRCPISGKQLVCSH